MQKDQTPIKKSAFLEALRSSGSVTQACAAAEIARCTPYAWRKDDREFAAEWDAAFDIGMDALEAELIRRAFAGDTTAAIFLLKGNKQHKYKDRVASEISGPDGKPVQLHALVDEGDAAQRLHAILQTAQARVDAARKLALTDQRTDADDLA